MARRLIPILITIGLLLCLLEVGSYGVGRFLQSRKRIFVPPAPPAEGARTFEEYMSLRDPVLGWPYAAQFGTTDYDTAGSRIVPSFPDPDEHPNCMTLFGDSFTEGGEVQDEERWANRLSIKLGCRVGNFAQSGYGTGQALLRYEKLGAGPEKVVLLGHMTENVVRHLTRNRDLVAPVLFWAQKPRFRLDDAGQVQVVPIPKLSKQEALRLIGHASPQLDLEHETFHPGGPAGAQRFEFPFSVSLLRSALGDYRMQALYSRQWPYAPLYALDHPLQATQLTVGIMKRFLAKAKERGQHPLLLILPMSEDVRVFRTEGRWTYQPLVDSLNAESIPFLDFGPRLVELTEQKGAQNLYMPHSHYNPEVNQAVADFVYEALERLNHPARPIPTTETSTPADAAVP